MLKSYFMSATYNTKWYWWLTPSLQDGLFIFVVAHSLQFVLGLALGAVLYWLLDR